MDNNVLIEEINRINELTGSKAIFTENKPFILTEQVKQIAKYVDDVFKVGKTAKTARISIQKAAKIELPPSWNVFKDLGKLNVAGGAKAAQHGTKVKTYLKHGVKTGSNMDAGLRRLLEKQVMLVVL